MTTTELIQKQIDEIDGLRSLHDAEDPKFKKWMQLTNAILEKKLPKNKADDFPSFHNFWPNRIGPWDEEELKESLIQGLNDAEAYLQGLIEEIELLGEESDQNRNGEPKLKMGEAGSNGRPGGGGSIFIQAENFTISGEAKISADGGDNISNIYYGTINQNTAEAIKKIAELMELVANSNLKENEKLQMIGDAEIVKASLIQPEPNKTILEKAWNGIQAASTVSGAVQLIQLISTFVLPHLK